MADSSNSIFNKKATEKLRNPDDLDKYVSVTNPGVWTILMACIALLAGLLCWGVFGTVTTNVTTTGVCVNGQAMCFLTASDISKVAVGNDAIVGGEEMTVANVAAVPISTDEASQSLKSDYLVKALVEGDWAYRVSFEGTSSSLAESVPLPVTITTEHIAPISLILGNET